MRIHRIAHTGGFLVVSNRTVQDERLSFNAIGVLTYLLSRRDGDVVNCRTLAEIGPSGRASVASALRELKRYCYYRVERVNDPVTGQVKSVSHVYERPYSEMGEGEEAAGGGEAERAPRVPRQRCRVPEEVTAEVPQSGNTGSTPIGVSTVEQKPTNHPEPRRALPLKPAVAAVLAKISAVAPRLVLGVKQRASLGPLVEEWLARGAAEEQVVAVATQGLPEDLLSPVGLVAYRLRNCMPPEPPPRVVPVAERPECEDCRRPLASAVAPPDGLCGECREALQRAVEWLNSPLPSVA